MRQALQLSWLIRGLLRGLMLGLMLGLSLPGGALAAPRRLAVLDLHQSVPVGAPTIETLADAVRAEALALPRADWFVLTREAVVAAFEADGSLADCVSDCELEVGRRLGAEVVITGELGQVGARLTLTLKAHETASGRFLAQQSEATEALEGLPEAATRAARALLDQLARPQHGEIVAVAPQGPSLGSIQLALDGVEVGALPQAQAQVAPGAAVRLSGPCVVSRELPGPQAGESLQLHVAFAPQLRLLQLSAVGSGGSEQAGVWVDGTYRGAIPGTVEVPRCGANVAFRSAQGWGFEAPLPPPSVEAAKLPIPAVADSSLAARLGLAMILAGAIGGAGYLAGDRWIGPDDTFMALGVASGLSAFFGVSVLASALSSGAEQSLAAALQGREEAPGPMETP